MKRCSLKVILSTFAMSLLLGFNFEIARAEDLNGLDDLLSLDVEEILNSDENPKTSLEIQDKSSSTGDREFLGLESEVLPELKGVQRFTPVGFHQDHSMNVSETQVELDKEPLKGQGYSLIPWSTLDPEGWLDIHKWQAAREIKDKNSDWKIRVRDAEKKELVGKVLQCKGNCKVFRGSIPHSVQHLSRIHEGDELVTSDDSQAWVFLMDGTLARISPKSSVTFLEINWLKEETFYLIRLNHGHVFWHTRSPDELLVDSSPETDAISLPLLIREANLEFYQREIYQGQSDKYRVKEIFSLEATPEAYQISKLNTLRANNWSVYKDRTRVMLFTPNATLTSKGTSFDAIYLTGGKSFFKKHHQREDGQFNLELRGYLNLETYDLAEMSWYEVEENGRGYGQVVASPEQQVLELLVKRIKSIELAREIWIKKFTIPILKTLIDSQKLAIEHGYVLWDQEHSRRTLFLKEWVRRMETTHLRSITNLITKLNERGEKPKEVLSDDFYRAAINFYLRSLKSRYMDKKMQIREMSDLQYYAWILKQGKL